VNLVQIDHDTGICFRRPRHDFGFHVIGEYGVEHRHPLLVAAMAGPPGTNAMAFTLKDVPPDQFPTIRIMGGFVAGFPPTKQS
jgi:hypothetical protein